VIRILRQADLEGCDLDALLDGDAFTVAIGADEVRGTAATAWLAADYAVLAEGAALILEEPRAWGAALWRIGRPAWRVYLATGGRLTAGQALDAGLADAVVGDVEGWIDRWLAGRSPTALASAGALIRRRGGDPLERAEFARLFAAGEPQIGLRAFLARRQPAFE
jgi:enoyl-CoA hydratase/carnithine racemase